ncbi:MAG: hypothetical protein RL091_785 [Verrucomicrobiota bacterium]
MRSLASLLCSLLLFVPVFAAATKGPEPLRIAHGEKVNLADYVVPGKTTVFDFTSEYCPPCRGYDGPLALLHQKNADIAVVKVDINRPGISRIDWQSPVAKQFAMRSIPHFKVYGPDGKLVAEDKLVIGADGKVAERDYAGRKLVDQWINAVAR